jgi:hypothetical protein
MSESFMFEYGAKLIDAGYRIIPIMPGTKKPGRYDGNQWSDMPRWPTIVATQTHLETWNEWPGCGIGIVTGEVVAIDIDVLDASVAIAIGNVFQEKLGKTDFVRIGKSPKALYLYRTEEPFSKISMHPIEVLGVGQQFVAYAIHPETNKPYQWPFSAPHEMALESLPLVTHQQVLEACEAAYKALPPNLRRQKLTHTFIQDKDAKTSIEGLTGTLAAVQDALKFVPNPDLNWDDWNRIGMAVYCATEGKGFILFDQWSQSSGKYNSMETRQRWDHYSKSPPSKIGAGTLYYYAQQKGWVPAPHLSLNPAKEIKVDLTGLTDSKNFTRSTKDNFPHEWLDSPSLVGRVTRWILASSLQPQPTFALMNTICMFGALFGRRYSMSQIQTRCNLFAIAVATPGAGKDHSRQQVKKLLEMAGLKDYISGDRFSSGVAILRTLHDFPSRISHLDEMGLYLQSLTGKMAGSHQKDIIKTLLEVYSSSGGTYHGQEYADNKDRQRFDIKSPNFNFFGTTTPSSLTKALNFEMLDNGTMSRILLVPSFEDYPNAQIPEAGGEPPEELIKDIIESASVVPAGIGNLNNLHHIANSEVSLITVKWEDEAFAEYNRLQNWQIECARKKDYLWVRFSEISLKIAMIEAIARNPVSPVVNLNIINMGSALAKWSFNFTAELLHKEVSENETEAAHKRILKIIRDAGKDGVSTTQLAKSCQSLKARDRNECLQTLLESGEVIEEVIKHNGPGRERKVFKLRR